MIASVIVLHERITPLMIAGAILILLGVIVSEGTLLKRQDTARPEVIDWTKNKSRDIVPSLRLPSCFTLS